MGMAHMIVSEGRSNGSTSVSDVWTWSKLAITSHGHSLRLSQYGDCSRPYSTLTSKPSRMRVIERPVTELEDIEIESWPHIAT